MRTDNDTIQKMRDTPPLAVVVGYAAWVLGGDDVLNDDPASEDGSVFRGMVYATPFCLAFWAAIIWLGYRAWIAF